MTSTRGTVIVLHQGIEDISHYLPDRCRFFPKEILQRNSAQIRHQNLRKLEIIELSNRERFFIRSSIPPLTIQSEFFHNGNWVSPSPGRSLRGKIPLPFPEWFNNHHFPLRSFFVTLLYEWLSSCLIVIHSSRCSLSIFRFRRID